jgi:hypothetical protein
LLKSARVRQLPASAPTETVHGAAAGQNGWREESLPAAATSTTPLWCRSRVSLNA